MSSTEEGHEKHAYSKISTAINHETNNTISPSSTSSPSQQQPPQRKRRLPNHRASARFSLATRISGAEHLALLNQSSMQYNGVDSNDSSSSSYQTGGSRSLFYRNNNHNSNDPNWKNKNQYSIKQDCSPTSIAISMCLCMNFVTIVATVILCLIYLNQLVLQLQLDRNQYSRQLFFPRSKPFAKSVRFNQIVNAAQTQTIIYSLNSSPLIEVSGYRTKQYNPVVMDALITGGMNYEYWTFTLNKGSVVHIDTLINYVPKVISEREDAIFLDIVVGNNYFNVWQNGKRSIAARSIQLTSGVPHSFQFHIVQSVNKTNSGQHRQQQSNDRDFLMTSDWLISEDMTDISINESTDSIYFIFYYHLDAHGTATNAMANFTVHYSNLVPDDASIIGQCLLLRQDCEFSRQEFPPVALIVANPDGFKNNTFTYEHSVQLYTNKVMPIALSPLMLCFALDFVGTIWIFASVICCGDGNRRSRKKAPARSAPQEDDTKDLSLLQNEHGADT